MGKSSEDKVYLRGYFLYPDFLQEEVALTQERWIDLTYPLSHKLLRGDNRQPYPGMLD